MSVGIGGVSALAESCNYGATAIMSILIVGKIRLYISMLSVLGLHSHIA